MKRDGHSHTHYCLHGSQEETEKYIIRAIEKGFQQYSVTEHLPLPESFLKSLPYPDEERNTFQIKDNDLDGYVKDMLFLQKKYRDRLEIKVGLEIDFLPEQISYTQSVLREYGSYLDDSLLAVHFLPGKKGWHCIDNEPGDFAAGLIDHYGDYESVQLAYYGAVREAILTSWGKYTLPRLAHLTLVNKFQKCFNPESFLREDVQKKISEILLDLKRKNLELDVNTAGLYKEHCQEIYPSLWIIKEAKRMGIPLIYGSDAHQPEEVGRGYEIYEKIIK